MSDSLRPTALVVEDEPAVLELLRAYLEADGYRVLRARTAAEALDIAPADLDVAVVDVGLPDMSGGLLAAELGDRCGGVGVILVTGYHPDDIHPRLAAATNLRLLTKPFPPGVLARACAEVRRRPAER